MQLQHVYTPCAAVQAIHILRNQRKFKNSLLHLHQGKMTRIGFSQAYPLAPHGIPIPHQFWIAAKSFGRCQVFGAILRPKTGLGISKCTQARFLRHARPRQNNNTPGFA